MYFSSACFCQVRSGRKRHELANSSRPLHSTGHASRTLSKHDVEFLLRRTYEHARLEIRKLQLPSDANATGRTFGHNCTSVRGYTASIASGNFQPIHPGDENVFHAPVLQLRQHLQPKLCTFRLRHPTVPVLPSGPPGSRQHHIDGFVLDVALVPHLHHQRVQVHDRVQLLQRPPLLSETPWSRPTGIGDRRHDRSISAIADCCTRSKSMGW